MKRFDARNAVIQALKEKGLYKGTKSNPMTIGICSRSKDIIEPLPKPQWWVACKDLGKRASDAARSGELEILPEIHRDTWYRWLENIQDWCISRQLWWGHRVPAYLVCIGNEDVFFFFVLNFFLAHLYVEVNFIFKSGILKPIGWWEEMKKKLLKQLMLSFQMSLVIILL